MTETAEPLAKPVLGISAILRDSFSLYARHFALFCGVVVIAYGSLVAGQSFLWETSLPIDFPGGYAVFQFVSGLVFSIVFLALQAILTWSAISLKAAGKAQLRPAIAATLKHLLPIIVLTFVAYFVIGLGLVLFVLPGLFLAAILFVMLPAIVFEGRGFGGAQRSHELVKGYRGPVMVVVVLVSAITGLGWAALGGATSLVDNLFPPLDLETWDGRTEPAYLVALIIVDVAVNAVIIPIPAVLCAVTYLRLREIKDGGETSRLLKVFE